MANDLTFNLIRQFGTADGHSFWSHLDGATPGRLIGKPVASSSAMDGVVTASAENYMLIFGDFSNYVIARRLGFTVERIAHLFATGNNRPSGQRGFFGFARMGAQSVNDAAFTLLNVS